jgi:hypothetical protein
MAIQNWVKDQPPIKKSKTNMLKTSHGIGVKNCGLFNNCNFFPTYIHPLIMMDVVKFNL